MGSRAASLAGRDSAHKGTGRPAPPARPAAPIGGVRIDGSVPNHQAVWSTRDKDH
jgi:hypothetical protein